MAQSLPLTACISLVNPTGGYQVNGMVNGNPTSFLFDTGATVTQMCKDAWDSSLGIQLESRAERNLLV